MPSPSLAGEAVERSGLLQVLFRRRFLPTKPLDALVNDGQKRREPCKQAEEEIQVGVVPTHVRLQRDFAPLASRGHTCRAPSFSVVHLWLKALTSSPASKSACAIRL